MKRVSLFLFALLLCLSSCQKKDKVVAQVYYHKLYQSDVLNSMPSGLSASDSIAMFNDIVDDWIKEQIVLHEAEKKLPLKSKNFQQEMESYRNSLLINKYYDLIVSKNKDIQPSDDDVRQFLNNFDNRYTVDKEIVKVNFVKLSKGSKLIEPVKAILFDKEKRQTEKEVLTKMLSDSIEYLIDDEAWLYLDDIQNEVSFEISKSDIEQHKCIEKEVGENHFLIVILDYKNQRSVSETEEEIAAARMMILNQCKKELIEQHINKLYEKALKEGSIIR